MVVLPFSKNCGLTAKIAGTVKPLVLLRGTAFIIYAPFKAVVEPEKALRFDLAAVNSYLPLVALIEPFAARVGSPDVALVSVPDVFIPVPERVIALNPKPISEAEILLLVVPELVTVALIESTYAALLRNLSGTVAVTKLLVLVGPNSPRLRTAASGLLTVPSVVTPPPVLPLKVIAPPEFISTNFETVALIVTVPAVLCAVTATAKNVVTTPAQKILIISLELNIFSLLLIYKKFFKCRSPEDNDT